MHDETRRTFLRSAVTAGGALGLSGISCNRQESKPGIAVPPYLRNYPETFQLDPHAASLEWFRDARFGMMICYGLYSLRGRGEWTLFRDTVPLPEYIRLKDQFTAERFDADFITDLAAEAGMKYINLVAHHHDSFSLFETKQNDWHSMNSPAKKDFVGELVEQCNRKGLGFFFYYSYALDWWHPYFYTTKDFFAARPHYEKPEPRYKFQKDEDFQHFIDYVHAQIREALTNYGPIAGMWFDPIMGYYSRPDLFPIEETYAMVRQLQPQTLITFKEGATGTEDFACPEHDINRVARMVNRMMDDGNPRGAEICQRSWNQNRNKHNELCVILQPGGYGWVSEHDGKHRGPDFVMEELAKGAAGRYNVLLNIGPLPDGSFPEQDVATLREVGKRIRTGGWPDPDNPQAPGSEPKDDQFSPATT